jgi:DNA-binding HxlR family transcriptional regulator
MKSYQQLCSVARALDIVGDRWNLLIVRELLLAPRLRFTDIQRGLPGVAPNLLVQRLRDLEQGDVVRRVSAAPPAAGVLYALTERGLGLEGVVRELLRWGAPTVPDAPLDAIFQMHWLALPARYLLHDNDPAGQPGLLRFGDISDGFDVLIAEGRTTVTPCDPDAVPDATVDGPGPVLVGLVQGALTLDAALAAGVSVRGHAGTLRRVLPTPPATGASQP